MSILSSASYGIEDEDRPGQRGASCIVVDVLSAIVAPCFGSESPPDTLSPPSSSISDLLPQIQPSISVPLLSDYDTAPAPAVLPTQPSNSLDFDLVPNTKHRPPLAIRTLVDHEILGIEIDLLIIVAQKCKHTVHPGLTAKYHHESCPFCRYKKALAEFKRELERLRAFEDIEFDAHVNPTTDLKNTVFGDLTNIFTNGRTRDFTKSLVSGRRGDNKKTRGGVRSAKVALLRLVDKLRKMREVESTWEDDNLTPEQTEIFYRDDCTKHSAATALSKWETDFRAVQFELVSFTEAQSSLSMAKDDFENNDKDNKENHNHVQKEDQQEADLKHLLPSPPAPRNPKRVKLNSTTYISILHDTSSISIHPLPSSLTQRPAPESQTYYIIPKGPHIAVQNRKHQVQGRRRYLFDRARKRGYRRNEWTSPKGYEKEDTSWFGMNSYEQFEGWQRIWECMGESSGGEGSDRGVRVEGKQDGDEVKWEEFVNSEEDREGFVKVGEGDVMEEEFKEIAIREKKPDEQDEDKSTLVIERFKGDGMPDMTGEAFLELLGDIGVMNVEKGA
ncbi:hypothetical protein B0J11DRAFT_574487 [Dendryphion nanum]|uniref:Uncharacterized protein n=1 Tax=Dendryphion nanum TaxID=256645 RepID=A0A9P9J213_9PLEO|nr:hypothetical protein B0J11DRAFT_574487 [Dendryphion nanum]